MMRIPMTFATLFGDLSTRFEADPWETILPLLGGICWSIVYLILICKTIPSRDKIFIPVLALSMNFVWEFVYAFILPVPAMQEFIDRVWFVLDLIIIIFTWRNYFNIYSAQGWWNNFVYLFSNLLIGVYVNWTFAAIIPESSAFYTAFVINVAMSYLFIVETPAITTATLSVAIFKMLGTAVTSLYGYIYLVQTDFMIVTYLLIFVLDCYYIAVIIFSLFFQKRVAKFVSQEEKEMM